eukprot:CAMPEP_0171118166 /NCGR_PEP_ID=MMETSP0766_2-20121228/94155_1 /TAXON_ID=439317 /ORGANISM="Gambierdiscus australes, Strain CAWD 149" /LENGTH=86 /DNA_ID=CAMNT_0011580727 /DNA_START=274 /DNA_END=531 /DNA_ORIENTATION=-
MSLSNRCATTPSCAFLHAFIAAVKVGAEGIMWKLRKSSNNANVSATRPCCAAASMMAEKSNSTVRCSVSSLTKGLFRTLDQILLAS